MTSRGKGAPRGCSGGMRSRHIRDQRLAPNSAAPRCRLSPGRATCVPTHLGTTKVRSAPSVIAAQMLLTRPMLQAVQDRGNRMEERI